MALRINHASVGWVLFVLLCSVYLITYCGLLYSVDELALFSHTESWVQMCSLQTPQLGFAPYHNVVGELEPLYSIAAVPLYWLAVQSEGLGNIQTVMLLNVLMTAATGFVLYLLLVALGHPVPRAVLATLIYGLATIAWPYSRTFFREPLVALLLALAAMGFVRWRSSRHMGFAAGCVLALLCALFTKVTSVLAWPAFALAFLLEEGVSRRARVRRLLILACAAAIGMVFFFGAYAQRWEGSDAKLLNLFYNGPTVPEMLARLFGLTLGAGRGLFVFSPILVLALPGLVLLWRRRRTEAILVSSALVFFLLGYSRYASWHGGLSWGSRFLVVVVPLLMLPVTEWLSLQGRVVRWATGLLVAFSLLVQCLAATSNVSAQVSAVAWDNLVDYARSPLAQLFRTWSPADLNMLWCHGPVAVHLEGMAVQVGLLILPLLAVVGAAAWLAVTVWLRKGFAGQRSWLLVLPLIGGMLVLLWQAPTATYGYPGINPTELRKVAGRVNQDRQDPRVIVTVSNEFQLNLLLNYFKGRFVHHWLSPAQLEGFETLTDPPFAASSLHLIVDRVHIDPDRSGHEAELWLNAHLHRYFVDWVGGGYEVYSYLFPPSEMPLQTVSYRWPPGMALSAWGVTPRAVRPGDAVWLAFHCSAWQPIEGRYDIFVQFLAPDGHYVNGTDGPPQFGAAMTSWWQPGEEIVDRRAFFVPAETPPGEYRVIAGFYQQGKRVPAFDADGQPLGTHIDLGTITVMPN